MAENFQNPTISKNSAMAINLALAAGYLLFGLSAEFLSIPPDYATPVWPAAGIALAFAIRFGAMVYPGIFVGALITNIMIANMQGVPFSITQVLFASSIAIGATLQAAVACFLLNRWKISPTQLRDGKEIVQFLLFAGPISCLINSLNGASMLCLFGIAPWELWITNWITWWVGDSVGALVLTPFILRLISPRVDDSQKLTSAVLSLTFLALVILSFFYMRDLEQDNRKAQVAETGDHIAVLLQSHIYSVTVVINALKSFFESSTHVDVEEFTHFSENLLQNNKTTHVLEWLPYIQHDQREETERYMHDSGYYDFQITARTPTGEIVKEEIQVDYLPILYAYPYESNKKIHGLNVLTLPYREKPSRLALETGKAYISAPLKLVQEKEGQTSYIVVKAVSDYQGSGNTGLVQSIFRVDSLVEDTLSDSTNLQGFSMLDITNPDNETLIYGNRPVASKYSWRSEFQFLNRKLALHLTPDTTLLMKVSSWQSYSLLIGGLLYVAMLEAILLSLLTRQRAIQFEVDLKTREIAEAKEVAEEASKAKTDFLASMSHELRTPLNAVIGFTHRVVNQKNTGLNERNLEALNIVEKNANHLLGLINNLLDITKVEKGKLELEYNQTDLTELLNEAASHFSIAANLKKNDVIFNKETDQDGMIEADTTRMRQVIMNVLSNAIKFTSNGTIKLTLKADSARDGYIIVIEDTGIGIAQDDLPKLFNKFQKVGNTSRINPQGTGLGLALSKEIVDLHGGRINVDSTLHQGTTFTIWLPISAENKTNV